MLTYSTSFKAKPKMPLQSSTQYLSTYQGDAIRKGIANNHQVPVKKDKTYRKVMTECNQGDNNESQVKKLIKQFKIPAKGGSPVVKKNVFVESSSSNKLCFSNNVGKIKKVKKSQHPMEKMNTQTGPIIQKTQSNKNYYQFRNQKEKDLKKHTENNYNELKNFHTDSRKENINHKKIDSKISANFGQYMKARLNTEGTIDSTPIPTFDIQLIQMIGEGTFGKVYRGKNRKTGESVAVKRVFQDPKYKNREIQIVSMLKGDFLMKVLGTYTTIEDNNQYLNIIMQFYEGDLFNYIRQNGKKGLNVLDIKIITYQIFRGLMFIHSVGIAHRDIKPHNILYKKKNIAICDFGSAKILTHQPNLPYICSRCYRAPELIFGATHYTTMIDIWSVGCVILQMIHGMPLFIGNSSIDHLIEIIKVLGTPTKTQVIDMNPQYDLNDYKFPKVKKREWSKIFPKCDELLLDLIQQIMIYSPKQRLNAAEALAHQFFDELREEQIYRNISKKYNLNLFSFTAQQIRGNEHLMPKLIPFWVNQTNF